MTLEEIDERLEELRQKRKLEGLSVEDRVELDALLDKRGYILLEAEYKGGEETHDSSPA